MDDINKQTNNITENDIKCCCCISYTFIKKYFVKLKIFKKFSFICCH